MDRSGHWLAGRGPAPSRAALLTVITSVLFRMHWMSVDFFKLAVGNAKFQVNRLRVERRLPDF